jgi:hypothetical protein
MFPVDTNEVKLQMKLRHGIMVEASDSQSHEFVISICKSFRSTAIQKIYFCQLFEHVRISVFLFLLALDCNALDKLAQEWLSLDTFDVNTRNEIKGLHDAKDYAKLQGLLGERMQFGTAG